jgi:hypothetical protein
MYHYNYELETSSTMERQGNTFENKGFKVYRFNMRAQRIDTLISYVITVDSIAQHFEMNGRRQDYDYGEIDGKRARFTVTPRGEYRSIEAVDSLPRPRLPGMPGGANSRINAANQLRPPSFVVPDRLLKTGDTWTETRHDTSTYADTTRHIDNRTITHSEIQYEVIGEETRLDLTCLHIQSITEYTRESEGSFSGSTTVSEGEGETQLDIWFAFQEGVLVEYRWNDFFEGTTAISGQINLTTPRSSESKVTLILTGRNSGK